MAVDMGITWPRALSGPFATNAPPPALPHYWQFWADTTIGATPLGPVQPTAFTCTAALSGFGSGTVTLPVASAALPQERILRLWSWRLWAFYGGMPVWCGCPTGITDVGLGTVELTLTELPGYLAKRMWDTAGQTVFTQTEQTEIARQLAAPAADVGVTIVTDPGPGFLRDRTYEYLENSRDTQLANLSQVIDGPEFRTEYRMAFGSPYCDLRIAYPRVGVSASALGITVPGAAVSYSAQWDADLLRTHTFAVGSLPQDAAAGATAPVVVVDRPQGDLPRLDVADDWTDVILVSTLTDRANTAAAQHADPVLTLSDSVSVAAPPFGTYGVGDDIDVFVRTPLLDGGLNVTGRLTGITVNAGSGGVEWTIAVALPPPQPRESLNTRLGRLDRRLAGVFRRGTAPVA